MNKKTVIISAALSGLMFLTSCVKEVMNEQPVEPTSRLSVITRAPANDQTVVAVPIHIYVFGSDGRCAARQVVEGDDELTPLALPEGTYDVYALGGVDNDRYTLPSQDDARRDSEIRLREGKVLDDLMVASAHVSLADGEEEQLTLGMERKVVLLKGATIRNVPDDVINVSVSLLPLYESVLLNGTLAGNEGKYSVDLQEQSDGTTWKSPTNVFLFPPSQKPTISVAFERENGTKSYAYTCKEDLAANYKLTIEGTYQAELGVSISGTVTGSVWDGEKTITLTFDEKRNDVTGDENGSGNNGGGNNGNANNGDGPSATTLKVGDTYKGCYVLAVDGKNVTLLSSEEKKGVTNGGDQKTALESIQKELSIWKVDGISATWVVPSESVMSQYLVNHPTTNNYFCMLSGNTLASINVYQGKTETRGSIGSSVYLRPVTTITIE